MSKIPEGLGKSVDLIVLPVHPFTYLPIYQ